MRVFELILTLILMLIIGALFLWFGWRIWKKEQITLIHDYHYTKVKETDKKPYTEKMGKAMLVIGAGIVLTGLINFITCTGYGWIAFAVCFVSGMIMIISAQMKYNHGIF